MFAFYIVFINVNRETLKTQNGKKSAYHRTPPINGVTYSTIRTKRSTVLSSMGVDQRHNKFGSYFWTRICSAGDIGCTAILLIYHL